MSPPEKLPASFMRRARIEKPNKCYPTFPNPSTSATARSYASPSHLPLLGHPLRRPRKRIVLSLARVVMIIHRMLPVVKNQYRVVMQHVVKNQYRVVM